MEISRRKYLAGIVGASTVGVAGCSSDTNDPSSGGKETSGAFEFQRPTIGEDDAPVTIVYWGDYQCPFCQKFEEEAFQKILSNNIETGEVKLVHKPIAVFGKDSERAARASNCVWENSSEDVFWEWHTKIMEQDNERNTGWASVENLVELSRDIDGVDVEKLESCMESGKYASRLQTDLAEGREYGLEGTPHFFIYGQSVGAGQRLSGAQPYSLFNQAINNYVE